MQHIEISSSTQIQCIRETIAEVLKAAGLLPAHALSNNVRIRLHNSYGYSLREILRDGHTLSHYKRRFTCEDRFIVQILEHPESVLPEEHPDDLLLHVRRWHRDSWKLSPCKDVLIPGRMTGEAAVRQLAALFLIPFDQLCGLLVNNSDDAHLCLLNKDMPVEAGIFSSMQWMDNFESLVGTNRIRSSNQLLHTLVLQDRSEPVRAMTVVERTTVHLYEEAIAQEGTLLHHVASRGYTQMCMQLIEMGADVNMKCEVRAALMMFQS